MKTRPRRTGFTLVELLMVVVIIAVLAALLLPVVGGAMRTARNSAVTADINTLSQAMASFNSQYGFYPPSRVMLSENGRYDITSADAGKMVASKNGAAGADITYAQLALRSITALRRFAPRAATSTTGYVWTTTDQFYDFDGDGVFDNDTDSSDGFYGVILEGDEALAFWLGGIPLNSAPAGQIPEWSMSGFGKRPTNPFTNNLDATGKFMYDPSRTPSMAEFKNDRLLDLDGDGFPSYVDSLGTEKPFAYFSAYGQGAYDPNDVNFLEGAQDGDSTPLVRAFRVAAPVVANANNGNNVRLAVSAPPNPYTSSAPVSVATTAWHKGQSFQIISAGADGLYGPAGQYDPNARTTHVPVGPQSEYNSTDRDIRRREADNLSNFAGGKLD